VAQAQLLVSRHKIAVVSQKNLLIRERVTHVYNEIDRKIHTVKALSKHPSGIIVIYWDAVPDYDKNYVDLVDATRSQADIAFELRAMAAELQPYLDRMFAGSDLVVKYAMDQSVKQGRKKRLVYLKFTVDARKWIEKSGGTIVEKVSTAKNPAQKRRRAGAKRIKMVLSSTSSTSDQVAQTELREARARSVQQRQSAVAAVQNMNASLPVLNRSGEHDDSDGDDHDDDDQDNDEDELDDEDYDNDNED